MTLDKDKSPVLVSKEQPDLGWGRVATKLKSWPWKVSGVRLGKLLAAVTALLLIAYLWGVIFYNGPFQQAAWGNTLLGFVWIGLLVVLLRLKIGSRRRIALLTMAALMVFIPYSFIRPSNDRDWNKDFAQTGYSETEGDLVSFHNFRNFDYTIDGKTTERWESRTVHLSNLRGLDLFHDTFMGDLMGHPILSFDFGPDGRVCLSVETRREKGEKFTPFGGLYKIFELQYLFSTEEDCIRLRTNVRKEPVNLYEIDASLDEIREMFLSSVAIQNDLAKRPRFYNVISANCTTSLRAQRPSDKRGLWDHRILLNGLLDEYLYERGRLQTYGLSFLDLRKLTKVNEAASSAHDDSSFSKRIRKFRDDQ